jgi:PHD/YefM family antitoxin component YafN of YafNO toxin-antitoxin module
VQEEGKAVHIVAQQGDAYVISGDEWRSLTETAHLLSSRTYARRLIEALEEFDDGGG